MNIPAETSSETVAKRVSELGTDIEASKSQIASYEAEKARIDLRIADARRLLTSSQAALGALLNG